MLTVEALEELYKINLDWVPRSISQGIGHFNVFKTELSDTRPPVKTIRNKYRIKLVPNNCQIFMPDRVLEIEKHSLIFAHPHAVYTLKQPDNGNSFSNVSSVIKSYERLSI